MASTREIVGLLGREIPQLHIIDVGAMSLGEGTEPYHRLVKEGMARVTGFEPVEEECAKMNAAYGPPHRFFPHAIGDGSMRTLHICNFPMTSSLYEPNTELLSLFHRLEEVHRVVRTVPVQTVRLDDIDECRGADYLKLDVQGAELDVLRGAERTLKDVLMIHVEVEFVPMYKGQPLFADIDSFIRSQGFMFHRMLGVAGRAFKPIAIINREFDAISQHLWSEAIYVRSFMDLGSIEDPMRLLKMVVLLHHHEAVDLARLVLSEYDRRAGSELAEAYMDRVATGKQGQ